jgi:chromate transport protein ChrA
MFNFSAYLGALAMRNSISSSIFGALLAYTGIFVPGLILQTALIPLWDKYRGFTQIKTFLSGVIACAVGLIYSALYILIRKAVSVGGASSGSLSLLESPLFTCIASSAFVLCGWTKVPTPVLILSGGIVGLVSLFV